LNWNRITLWFGMIGALILVVGIGVFAAMYTNYFSSDTKASTETKPAAEKTEPAPALAPAAEPAPAPEPTPPPAPSCAFPDTGQFIAQIHTFYNNTTGFGKDKALNYEQQREKAKLIIDTIDCFKPTGALGNDLGNAHKLAEIVMKENNHDAVVYLHRIFHDLDRASNNYKAKDEFGVTETFHGSTGWTKQFGF
jgi:hypothetical protein